MANQTKSVPKDTRNGNLTEHINHTKRIVQNHYATLQRGVLKAPAWPPPAVPHAPVPSPHLVPRGVAARTHADADAGVVELDAVHLQELQQQHAQVTAGEHGRGTLVRLRGARGVVVVQRVLTQCGGGWVLTAG